MYKMTYFSYDVQYGILNKLLDINYIALLLIPSWALDFDPSLVSYICGSYPTRQCEHYTLRGLGWLGMKL